MLCGLARSVTYRQSWDSALYVDRLTSVRDVEQTSARLRELILRSYVHAYEEGGSDEIRANLPRGTIATLYNAANDRRFRDRAIDHYERGTEFWVVRPDGASEVVAFAKVTPGEKMNDPRPGTLYINDVVVDPGDRRRSSYQRKGYGRTALHAALKFGGHRDMPVWLEAFEASEDRLLDGYIVPGPNKLYRNMGLERTGGADPFEFPNGAELWMCEYGAATIEGAVWALETRYQDLREANAHH